MCYNTIPNMTAFETETDINGNSDEIVAYTSEDRLRVSGLIEDEDQRRSFSYSADGQEFHDAAIPFRLAMREEGPVAAAVILDRRTRFLDVQEKMDLLALCAGPGQMHAVMDLMVENARVAYDVGPLVNVMQRVADETLIPKISEMAQINFSGQYVFVADALRIAMAAEQRQPDPARKEEWLQLIDSLAQIKAGGGERQVSDEFVGKLRKESSPGEVALQYAELFCVGANDTSLNYRAAPGETVEDLGRANTLRNLASVVGTVLEIDIPKRIPTHVMEKLVSLERPGRPAVTLGIEIEVERDAVTDVGVDGQDVIAVILARLQNMNRVAGAGVPLDDEDSRGIYKEFALAPSAYYATLSREVQAMMALDVINPRYVGQPLHLTVGEISTVDYDCEDAFVLARSLEATGWSCSGDRLRQPLGVEWGNWAQRGEAGLDERGWEKIQGGSLNAVEIRTFSLESLGGLDRTLRSAYALGSALSAYQSRHQRLDSSERQLAAVWGEFSSLSKGIFDHYGMDVPDWNWQLKFREAASGHGTLDKNFLRLASLLDQAKADSDSEGGRFQDEIQRAVIASRAKAMGILEAEA